MKSKLLLLSLLAATFGASSQDADTSYWHFGGATTATFSQVSLTNWAAGGENSISLNGYFNFFVDYAKDRITLDNNLEMGYGIVKQGEGAKPEKTDDILIISSQFGYKFTKTLFWSSLIDFRTQFYRGVDDEGNLISDFMAPGYLLVATGFEWKPVPALKVTYAPITGKWTIVNDDELAANGAFGVDPGLRDINGNIIQSGSSSRTELGSFLKIRYKKENLIENVNFLSKLELFTNYLENFGEIDVNWQNQINMKINSILSVNLQTQLIYDKDIVFSEFDPSGELISEEDRVQFKSVFGVGLAYTFGEKKG